MIGHVSPRIPEDRPGLSPGLSSPAHILLLSSRHTLAHTVHIPLCPAQPCLDLCTWGPWGCPFHGDKPGLLHTTRVD